MKTANHSPIHYPPTETPRRPTVDPRRRHKWNQCLAYFYCAVCDTTAEKLRDGQLVALNDSGDRMPSIDLYHCGGPQARREKERLRERNRIRGKKRLDARRRGK